MRRFRRRLALATVATIVAACAEQQNPADPDFAKGGGGGGPDVNQAIPDSASQDTTLDVRVLGKGFDNGSKVGFLKNGSPAEKITVNSTQYVSNDELIANVTVDVDAVIDVYDVEVTTRRGKKGIGSELFNVVEKGKPNDPEPVDSAWVQVMVGYPAVLSGSAEPDGDLSGVQYDVLKLTDPLALDVQDWDISYIGEQLGRCVGTTYGPAEVEFTRAEDGSGQMTIHSPPRYHSGTIKHHITLTGSAWQGAWPLQKGTRIEFTATNWSVTSDGGKGSGRCKGSGTFDNPVLVEIWTMQPPPPVLPTAPFLARPFTGDFPMRRLFDHEYRGATGMITSWGERAYLGDDPSYSWLMPVGTPILAAASGTVVFNGRNPPRRCQGGNVVPGNSIVAIEHVAPSGQHVATAYYYMSSIDVTVGQSVVAGEQIGLSGSVPCDPTYTLFLLATRVEWPVGEDFSSRYYGRTDPYGWSGPGPDPYLPSPRGINSEWLWLPGEAPPIYRENFRPLGMDPVVTLTRWRWMTDADAADPNNEFIEISLNPASGSTLDLTGYYLLSEEGLTFALPPGATVTTSAPLRVFSGTGTDTATEIYMGRATPMWDNVRDCANLYDPLDTQQSRTCIYYPAQTSN